MFGLYSSLVTLALSSLAWPSGVGVGLGISIGGAVAFLLIDRVLRAQGATPQRGLVRRLASLCCLTWGLVLPIAMAAAGLLWGAGYGVGTLIEGPVSTTVRETVHTTLTAVNGVGGAVLRRLPLAKRLSERELLTMVQAAPEWIAAALDQDRLGSLWQRATGAPMPPQLAPLLQREFRALTSHHSEWLRPAVEKLRARAQGTAGDWPTVEEAIEATVAPAVFHDAGTAIRATTRRDALLLGLGALAVSALLAVGLRLAWRRPLAAPIAATTPAATAASARESAHG
jgi:hypothetical protein